MKIKALVIEPKNDIYFKEIDINKFEDSDVKIKWTISSVCNSERRRFNLTKSAINKDSYDVILVDMDIFLVFLFTQ